MARAADKNQQAAPKTFGEIRTVAGWAVEKHERNEVRLEREDEPYIRSIRSSVRT